MTPEHTALVARLVDRANHTSSLPERLLEIEAAAAIRALAGEVGELRASVKEWGCEKCNYVYPGPPQAGFKCITCPRCHGSTMPLSLMKVRAAERERDTLRAELEAEKAAHWRTCQTAAHEAEERDRAVEELGRVSAIGLKDMATIDTLRAEVEALKEQNTEFLSQASEGLKIDHDCPAVYACAYILSELTPDSEKTDAALADKQEPT